MSVLGRSFALRTKILVLVAIAVVIVAAVYLTSGPAEKKVVVYFDQAISVYPGTDVDIMGVHVGQVDSVTPAGGQVKVEISYDGQYQLPADVRAAVVTPSLVADRFVQFEPGASGQSFFGGGPVLADGGTIERENTAVPIELDQIYKSLSDLTTTLGPNGVNKDGSLSALLHATAKALDGNGELGGEALANFSKAAKTLGVNSNQIFSTVDHLAALTTTLQENDKFVQQFMGSLGTVSTQLAGESDDLQEALAAIAHAVGTVQAFVHDNRSMLKADLKQLTTTVDVLARQKKTLGDVLQYSALGLGNLADAYDNTTGTIGIRAQLGPIASDLGNVLCGVVTVNKLPNAGAVCDLFHALLSGSTNLGAGLSGSAANAGVSPSSRTGIQALLSGLGRKK